MENSFSLNTKDLQQMVRSKVTLIKTNVLSEVNWIKRPLPFSLTTTKECVINQREVQPVSSELPHAVHGLPEERLCGLLCRGSVVTDETITAVCYETNGRETLAPCRVHVSSKIKGIGRQAIESYRGPDSNCPCLCRLCGSLEATQFPR